MLPHIRWRLEEVGRGGALATFWPRATSSQLRGAPGVKPGTGMLPNLDPAAGDVFPGSV